MHCYSNAYINGPRLACLLNNLSGSRDSRSSSSNRCIPCDPRLLNYWRCPSRNTRILHGLGFLILVSTRVPMFYQDFCADESLQLYASRVQIMVKRTQHTNVARDKTENTIVGRDKRQNRLVFRGSSTVQAKVHNKAHTQHKRMSPDTMRPRRSSIHPSCGWFRVSNIQGFQRWFYYVQGFHQGMNLGRPMSCVPGYFEVINTHTVGFLTIPRACIKWV